MTSPAYPADATTPDSPLRFVCFPYEGAVVRDAVVSGSFPPARSTGNVCPFLGTNTSATALICSIGASVRSNSGRRRSRHPVNPDSRYTFVETCAAQPFCSCAARLVFL